MNNLIIREIRKDEYKLLEDFLYEAIFIPVGVEKPSRDIIKNKNCKYISKTLEPIRMIIAF